MSEKYMEYDQMGKDYYTDPEYAEIQKQLKAAEKEATKVRENPSAK